MTPETVVSETPKSLKLKSVRKYVDRNLEKQSKYDEFDWTPAATTDEALDRLNGDVLDELNAVLQRKAKIENRKNIQLPEGSIKVAALKAIVGLIRPAVEAANGNKKAREITKMCHERIKNDPKLFAATLSMNEIVEDSDDDDADNEE